MSYRRVLVTAFLLLAPGPFLPAGAAPQAPPAGADPVVRDVLRMQQNGVSEAAMLEWLHKAQPRVGALTPDDLIALAQAKVPDSVVTELVSLSEAAATPAPPATGPPPAAPVPQPPERTEVEARFTLSYRPETMLGDDPWDFCAYVDGTLIGCLPGGGSGPARRTQVVQRSLGPGAHTVRGALERHSPSRSRPPNEARANPDPLIFRLAPGLPAKIEVEFDEGSLDIAMSPLRWSVVQGDQTLVPIERAGGKLAKWRTVCEEIELDVGPKGPTLNQRTALKDCVRWASLWPGVSDLPPRDSVRPK